MNGNERDLRAGDAARPHGRTVAVLGAERRRTIRTVLRWNVAVAVGAGLLVACGDDKGDDAASVGDFCAQMERMNLELDSRGWFEIDDDGGDVTLDAVRSVDAPAEIGDQWDTVIEMTEQNAEAQRNDTDIDGSAESEAAADRVTTYADVQCSVYLGSS